MLNQSYHITNFLDRLTKVPTPSFSLASIPGFPSTEYQKLQSRYTTAESWYSGEVLDETIEQEGGEVELYPVKINPIKGAVEKHTHFLFGQVSQDDRPLVNARMALNDETDEWRKLAKDAENALAQVWFENNGRALQWENGATSQVYGGSYWHIVYDPYDALRSLPIRLENLHPKFVVALPHAFDMWKLRECWIVQPITHLEAQELGVYLDETEDPWFVQYYTEHTYNAWVNDKPASRMVDGKWRELSGQNEWGVVPVVYIPHIRVLGFYGENLFDTVKGLIKEINLRVADFGDAVTVDAHAYLGMRNVNGAPTVQKIAPNLNVINIGNNPNITGQDSDPDLFPLLKSGASDPMKDLVELLYSLYRRMANIPSVVDGEDEGGQRSGLTLATRMIALTSHTEAERVFWTAGLSIVNRMILRILQITNSGIDIRQATMRLKLEWAPILPRDREMVVTEAVSLMAAKLGSPQRLLELLGVDNVDEEFDLIMEFWDAVADMDAKKAQAQAQEEQKGLKSSSTAAQSGQKAKEKQK